ncbi:MAG: hypothetical protein PUD03_03810 [Lachnospiraceae bacterium]|nr:hypothetical protein [Lachnospiraceae bacterium]MDD5853211.1 hypothetical protein [Lachnospiraceae bacterium]
MINQDRLRLMTKMAAYEAGEGQKNMAIASYFRSDYLGFQIIKSVICATIAYAILFGLFIYYDFENFMQDIYKMDLMSFARNVLLYYAIFVVGYGIICYIVYSIRYYKAKKSLKKYYNRLKQLSAMYDLEKRKG